MHKTLSILSKTFAVIGLCGSAFAVGALTVGAYPAYTSHPQIEDKPKPLAGQQTVHRLSVNDWVMIAKKI